ncbi:MAG: group III truncated hemoglobin, partial [Myxococcota bacterium]
AISKHKDMVTEGDNEEGIDKDLKNRQDIDILMAAFYRLAMKDELIGHFFIEVAPLDMEQHLPLIGDFWESVLFQGARYKGNPLQVHQDLHERYPLRKEHFERWLGLFNATVDNLYRGQKATLAKTRALSIATVLQVKLHTQRPDA